MLTSFQLYYFGNCISFIQFIFIINFLQLLSGRIISAHTDCANGCNVTLGHNMFFYITNCLHEHKKSARRLRLFACQKFNTSLN